MKHKFLYKIYKTEDGQIKGDWYVIDRYWRKQGLGNDHTVQLETELYESIEDAKTIIENLKRWFGDNYEFEALKGSLV